MDKKTVCMILRGSYISDSRVEKEAQSLLANGFKVSLIGLQHEDAPDYEVKNGVAVYRLPKRPLVIKKAKDLAYGIKHLLENKLDAKAKFKDSTETESINKEQKDPFSEEGFLRFDKFFSSGVTKPAIGWQRPIKRSIFDLLMFSGRLFVRSAVKTSKTRPVKKFMRMIGQKIVSLRIIKKGLELKPDVYHVHDYYNLGTGVTLKLLTRKKLIYDTHELFAESRAFIKRPMKKRFVIMMESILIRHVDAVITVTDSIAGFLSKRYRIKKPVVLRNIPELDKNLTLTDNNLFREQLGISENKKIALYQGGMARMRGLPWLVRAAEYLQDTVIVFMGKGPVKDQLIDMAKELGVEEKVFFIEPVSRDVLLKYTSSADLGVIIYPNSCLNSYFSGPNKLFEYIAAGIPVLSSSRPEWDSFVVDKGLGISVKVDWKDEQVDDEFIKEIAANIEGIFAKSQEYLRMRSNAKSAGLGIGWQDEEKKLIALYGRLFPKQMIRSSAAN